MTIVIVSILLLGCLLIATENITKVNRAAVAIFAGTVGWVLYICFGMDFVTSQHAYDFRVICTVRLLPSQNPAQQSRALFPVLSFCHMWEELQR